MAVALVPVCAGRRGRQLVTPRGQADQKQKDGKEAGLSHDLHGGPPPQPLTDQVIPVPKVP